MKKKRGEKKDICMKETKKKNGENKHINKYSFFFTEGIVY
jgi:hypothetical protein